MYKEDLNNTFFFESINLDKNTVKGKKGKFMRPIYELKYNGLKYDKINLKSQ